MSDIKLTKKSKNFVDISLAFGANPKTGDISVLKNERAINQSVKNIIMFVPGEVPFQHDIGSRVSDYLFESFDLGTAGLIDVEIRRAIAYNEPRVEVIDVSVVPDETEHQYACTIIYRIVGYDTTFTVDHLLKPTR
jgi:hypothetical protein